MPADHPFTTSPVLTRAAGRGYRIALFFAFAFAVMADPVSSVAYAIEAALRALNGASGPADAHDELIVLAIIALVDINYWQLVRPLPAGRRRRRRRRDGRSAPAGRSYRSARWSSTSS